MKLRFFIGVAAVAMSTSAFAENYVSARYASASVKDDQLGLTFKGSAYGGDLRYDFQQSPVFGLAAITSGSVDNSDLGTKITVDETSYGFGLGYALQYTKTSELYMAARYSHADDSASAPGFGSADSTSDGVAVAFGGHVWLNDLFRGYGDVSYISASHKNKGPALALGLEARINPSFGLFLEYAYASIKDDSSSPSDTVKTSTVGGGIRIPFGGNR